MDASEATKHRPTQAAKPSLTFKEPFSVDSIAAPLARSILRPQAVLAFPGLLYLFDRRHAHRLFDIAESGRYPRLLSLKTLRQLLFRAYPKLGYIWAFAVLRLINAALERYASNLGEWKADKPDWSQEVVVVTGGARGIGALIVEMLSHEKRAKVAVLDLGEPEYAPAPRGAPAVQYYKVDVADADQVKAAGDAIRSTLGHPTMVVNNAGLMSFHRIVDADPENVARLWRVNTLAHFVTVREFLPAMVRANHGHIMALTSSASFMSLAQMSEYTTSKTASLAFFECLRAELRSRYFAPRVRTSLCAPTKVQTTMGNSMESHELPFLHPTLHPYQVARKMVDALDSGLSHYMVMPGLMKILPLMRGVPYWLRWTGDIIAKSDHLVNDSSALRAYNDGYGKEWSGTSASDRDRFLAGLKQGSALSRR